MNKIDDRFAPPSCEDAAQGAPEERQSAPQAIGEGQGRVKGRTAPQGGPERSEAVRRIRSRVVKRESATAVEAMRRLKGYQRDYVIARAGGDSMEQAWIKAKGQRNKKPIEAARRMEQYPHVAQAIAAVEEAVLKGSVMSAAQRRDYVLDRLVVESTAAGDSARVRAIELLGKTAGLFVDRTEVQVTHPDQLQQRIEAILRQVSERQIDGETLSATNGPDALDALMDASGGSEPSA